jgi:hypothetical protein
MGTYFALALVTSLLALAALASTARAHWPTQHPASELKAPKVHVIYWLRGNLNRALQARCLPARNYGWKPAYRVPVAARTWVIAQTQTWIREARERPSRCVPHRALWECIHSTEGDWQDGGWPYWGGLQMGDWFLGRYMNRVAPGSVPPYGSVGPNGWANAPSPEQQMKAAELGWRESGYSLAWLRGQWPNSSPPCASGGVL